jgi:enamine deaminase RidA (YjgF/YER057c/UK114 family)
MLKRTYLYIESKNDLAGEIALYKEKLQEKYASKIIIGITFFIRALGDADFIEKRELIRNFFENHFGYLPVSVISQPAIMNEGETHTSALEVWTHDTCENLVYKKIRETNYAVYNDSIGKSIWSLGISTNDCNPSFREQAHFAFEMMQTILSTEGFTMDELVRQWNYIPNILQTLTENENTYQNYQLFNDIRQYYYGIYKRNAFYPAATGIGMEVGPVSIDFHAVQKDTSNRIIGLSNPNQINAYDYGQEVLVGSPLIEKEGKKKPLFERAKYIASPSEALIYISGTASIVGEKTIGQDDVARQTLVTINNLLNLTTKENLESAGVPPNQSHTIASDYLRAYIKNPEDINTVREICEDQYGAIPVLYVKADICRDDLLVEIEGEMALW